ITNHYDIRLSIQRILAADIDLALICHKGPNIEIAFEQVLKEITDSAEVRARGIKSVERIMAYKKEYLSL
ncbi:MAG: beta-N-acetylhexosaminidase, partial [bacterium]|nr:beta-N-acetylhexosaminidase [bacterium]